MFNYGDTIEYTDATWDENFNSARKWCRENNATFDELIDERKEVEVEKTRTIETYEEQEQIVPAEYDEEGNLIKEETTDSEQDFIDLLQYKQYLRDITKDSAFPDIQIKTFEEFKTNKG